MGGLEVKLAGRRGSGRGARVRNDQAGRSSCGGAPWAARPCAAAGASHAEDKSTVSRRRGTTARRRWEQGRATGNASGGGLLRRGGRKNKCKERKERKEREVRVRKVQNMFGFFGGSPDNDERIYGKV
ncbi:hypothetical protein TRIUR3_29646 [Triticum urartu]|uniref:Uncharacterized protein n=1 Tax=Triticum urartu TaxID=4572 RepID=M7ZPZ5_TRIUA|nr:hypothetical protein TRIUR3_29646 [Triticum urartu]